MTAGDFAKASGLSPKALRLYADSGLLPPRRIDDGNGYRYYGDEQVARAERITMLRRAGAPLAVVASIIDAPDPSRSTERLSEWWQRQVRQYREQQGIVDFLLDVLSSPEREGLAFDVRRRSTDERMVASVSRRVQQLELVACFVEADRLISQHLAAHGASRGVEFWVIYHGTVSPDSDGPIEICVPFEGLVPPTSDIGVRVEPAGDELYVEIDAELCGYPQILQAYAAVARAARDRTVAGAVRERYIAEWDGSPGLQHVADIVQPIAPIGVASGASSE